MPIRYKGHRGSVGLHAVWSDQGWASGCLGVRGWVQFDLESGTLRPDVGEELLLSRCHEGILLGLAARTLPCRTAWHLPAKGRDGSASPGVLNQLALLQGATGNVCTQF